MWSDKYNYYSIQSDINSSRKVAIEKVVSLVLQTNSFIQKSHQSFTNAETFPWADMIIVQADNGNFAAADKRLSYINLIAITCSKGSDVDQSIYKNVFLNIADQLNWKLFLESDDVGNENIEIFRA